MSKNDLSPPPLTISFGDIEIKMTYGLEMDIRRMLPDPQSAMTLIMSDPFTQDYIVRRCLTNKNKMVMDDSELIPMESVELTSDQVNDLLMWVMEYVMLFFETRAQAMKSLGEKHQKTLIALSPSGSQDSASTTQSAGPSE